MRTVGVAQSFSGTVHEAERCWCDVSRWPDWVDGLERVDECSGHWPQIGAVVKWSSGPAGRGHVVERVVAYEPLDGQTVEVEDDSIRGRQSVSVVPAEEGVEVALRLEYEIKKRSLFTAAVDWLFIRGAMERSLRATLTRFGAELAATRQSGLS